MVIREPEDEGKHYPVNAPSQPGPSVKVPLAVVDTSFWTLACITGLEPHLWAQWPIIAVPYIVQRESGSTKSQPDPAVLITRL